MLQNIKIIFEELNLLINNNYTVLISNTSKASISNTTSRDLILIQKIHKEINYLHKLLENFLNNESVFKAEICKYSLECYTSLFKDSLLSINTFLQEYIDEEPNLPIDSKKNSIASLQSITLNNVNNHYSAIEPLLKKIISPHTPSPPQLP